MINPRKSDGLFDDADILPTMVSLAGVSGAQLADLFPKTTYIDGVDQASFLVADNGLSARRSRPYTLNQYYAALRIDEFKGVMTAEIENGVVQKGDWGGFSGPIFTDYRLQSLYQSARGRERRYPPHPGLRADHGGVRLLSEGAHQVSAAVQDRLHVEQSARL
jgi:arylsulfatase A-like enzyme